jgi:3-methyladenine DNA glycosylase/8-oxoguanine DNA glycosylase
VTSGVDLVATLGPLRHGPFDPTIDLSPGLARLALDTPTGPATLELGADGHRRAHGPGAAWALSHADGLLGARDERKGFDPTVNPVVDRLARRKPGLRLCASGRVLSALVPFVLAQKVTSEEAHRSWSALVRRHGMPAPGAPDLRVPPSASTLATLPYGAMHPLGIERRRAEVIRRAAAEAPRFEALADDPTGLGARLRTIPGIGPWTEAKVRQVVSADRDAVPLGDYNLPSLVGWNLAREPHADDERMLVLLEPFAGHRARVLRLLVLAGERPPRRGPKRRLRSIARI